jgi:diacylglycerol kinase family enzyme
VHVDGVPMPRAAYRAAFFCNLRTYGKAMSVAPDAHRRSGLIHAQARKYASPPALAVQLGAALAHRPAPAFVSDHATGARFEIVSDRPFPVQVDGDARGRMRALTVGVLPSEIRILAPAGRALTAPDPTADER